MNVWSYIAEMTCAPKSNQNKKKTTDAQKHTSRIIDYLVNSRKIDARRIVTMVGGARDELKVELWIAPQGAKPPSP